MSLAASPGRDPAHPAAARIYDYLLGGKDNYPVDRAAADKVLVLSQFASDSDPRAMAELRAVSAGTPVQTYFRPRSEILRFFDGFTLTEPGLTDVQDWRPDSVALPTRLRIAGAVGRRW